MLREVRLLTPFAALHVDAYIAAHGTKYLYLAGRGLTWQTPRSCR